jgi:hypothetical protein
MEGMAVRGATMAHDAHSANHEFTPAAQLPQADLRMYEDWLATASMGDPRQAGEALLAMLARLEQQPASPGNALKILEWLHPRIGESIEQHCRRFSGKALPLSVSEQLALKQVRNLSAAMTRHYQRLQHAGPRRELPLGPGPAEQRLCALRVIQYSARSIEAAYLARQEVAPASWQMLHRQYALAEKLGIAQAAAEAGGDAGDADTCMAAYLPPLLFALVHPYGLSGRELRWVSDWLRAWGAKAALRPRVDKPGAPAVDLDGDGPPTWTQPADGFRPERRYLDTTALRNAVRKRLHLLASGHSPADVGLGADCVQPAATRLLQAVLAAWSSGAPAPHFPRRTPRVELATAEAAVGLPAVHLAMTGTRFEQAAPVWDYNTRGEALVPRSGIQRPPLRHELWHIADESATGFRLRRDAAEQPGPSGGTTGLETRVAHQQLVAVRPRGSSQFILAEVRWLMQGVDDSVCIGIQALPGMATACAARREQSDPTRSEPYVQAFLLTPPRGLDESLVLPSGSFQSLGGFEGRLEIRVEDGARRARMASVVQRGYDYERAVLAPSG